MNNNFDELLKNTINNNEFLDQKTTDITISKSKKAANYKNIILFILLLSGLLFFLVNNAIYYSNHTLNDNIYYYSRRISLLSLVIVPIFLNKEFLLNLIERK
jgi:hypothetical protein